MRMLITKQVHELGFDVKEAEDGEQGLLRLSEFDVDLILLDCTMPVLDGPGMLQRMRSSGNQTPVIMLTSESKRSVVSGAMKLGLDDYILKPFKPEELRQKIVSALQKGGAAVNNDSPAPAPAPAPVVNAPARTAHVGGEVKQFVDVLVVDDMENVQKRLRALLHERVTLQGTTSAQAAVAMCRERVYRVILLDIDIPEVNSFTLAGQLRLLQPQAAVVALALRTTKEMIGELKKQQGFDEVLLKPFTSDGIEDFTLQFFDNQEVFQIEDNLLRLKPFIGKPERMDRYCQLLVRLVPPILLNLASACFDSAIIDVTLAPLLVEKFPRVLPTLATQAEAVGLALAVVGPPGIERMLSEWDETKRLRCFSSVADARAGHS